MVKRILVVGMLDSIHLARWLEQFKDEKLDISIFPSRKYRFIHPQLWSLTESINIANFQIIGISPKIFRFGHVDFMLKEIFGKFFKSLSRKYSLQKTLKKNNFELIHAIEIQGGGYLIGSIEEAFYKKSKIILTNWGSDIYYFMKNPKHLDLIKNLLKRVDYYSAECERDYKLARDLGFSGQELPCIPNSGGFDVMRDHLAYVKPSLRNQIIIKGYGGLFGRPDILIQVIGKICIEFPNLNFFIYSVTKDSLKLIMDLPKHVRKKIKYSTVRRNLSRLDLLNQFSKSRIYIGCSESDGISTSFLESLISGSYPIQSNTSCADEWIKKGAVGSVVPLDFEIIMESVRSAVLDADMVDSASDINFAVSQKYLSHEYISGIAKQFYIDSR
jgi:hypothetical protein